MARAVPFQTASSRSLEHESRAGKQYVLKRTDTRGRIAARCNAEDVSLVRFKGQGRPTMPLIQLVQVFIVVAVLLWLVNRFIPMPGSVKSIE